MRESWTDDRLDDLTGKVDALRLEMRTEFKAIRGEMKAGFEKLDRRFEEFEIRGDERFEAMMDRLYFMQRMMFQLCGGGLVALIGFIATQV